MLVLSGKAASSYCRTNPQNFNQVHTTNPAVYTLAKLLPLLEKLFFLLISATPSLHT